MQLSTILLSGLLATQVVNAKKKKHEHKKSTASSEVQVTHESTVSSTSSSSATTSSSTSSSSSTTSSATSNSFSSTVVSSTSSSSSSSSSSTSTPYVAGEPWATLTPADTYQCGFTNYNSSFGIAVKTISLELSNSTTSATTSAKDKRELIAPTPALDVITDGKVRAMVTKTSADESITTTTLTRTKTVVMSASTTYNATLQETGSGFNETLGFNASDISVSNITNLFTNSSGYNATLLNSTAAYLNGSHYINGTSYNATAQCTAQLPTFFNDISCKTNATLSVTLIDSVLKDATNRTGTISSSNQFQFDGPFPQNGTLFAAGWSITPSGYLALGDNDIFYECLSNESFYNLYNQFQGSECVPIQLEVVSLIDC